MDDNFLAQEIEKPTRRGATLDLVLNNKLGLVRNGKLKGSLGCSTHEMLEFKILREARTAHSKLEKSRLWPLHGSSSRVPWDKAPEGKGNERSSLIFKNHLFQTWKKCIPTKKMSGIVCQEDMDESRYG